jgi:hypothetical protein
MQAPSPRAAVHDLRVIDEPATLDPHSRTALADAFIRLAWRATGGARWKTYSAARDGWGKVFLAPGGRPEDYARLALVHAGGELVHFTAVHDVALDARDTLVWFHVTATHPDHRGLGLLNRAIYALLDDWLHRLPGERITVVFRTPNPIVYEALRGLGRAYRPKGVLDAEWYPEIDADGAASPVPADVRALAIRVAARLSPDRPFDPETFVIDGHFAHMGPVFADLEFPCADAGSRRYFDRHLARDRQDGLLVLAVCTMAREAGRHRVNPRLPVHEVGAG